MKTCRPVEGQFTLKGRECFMLEGPDACKEVFILFQPKVNTGFGNHSVNFVKKAAQASNCYPSEWTRAVAVRFALLHLKTGPKSGILTESSLKYLKGIQFEWYSLPSTLKLNWAFGPFTGLTRCLNHTQKLDTRIIDLGLASKSFGFLNVLRYFKVGTVLELSNFGFQNVIC